MLSLEEAIKYYLELAEENEKDAEQFKRIKATQDMISHCYECAKEHRQLAEWLRELKESRMVLDILGQFLVDTDIDVCCEDLAITDDYCEKYCDNKKPLCWYRWAKAKASEVNTDDID